MNLFENYRVAHKYQFDKLSYILKKMLYLKIPKEEIEQFINESLNDTSPSLPKITSEKPLKQKSGRKPGLTKEKQKIARAAFELYQTNLSISEICTTLKIQSKTTLYKYIDWAQNENTKS